MRKKLYILLYTVIFCVCTTYAQDDAAMRELYAQAEDAYRIGRIEQARDLLLQNLSTFQGNLSSMSHSCCSRTHIIVRRHKTRQPSLKS